MLNGTWSLLLSLFQFILLYFHRLLSVFSIDFKKDYFILFNIQFILLQALKTLLYLRSVMLD
jgi:hypothetical protein